MLQKVKSPQIQLALIAILSRILILSLGKSSSLFFQRFDKSSSLASNSYFKFLESWDTVHFLGIAKSGYNREHWLPFFPLLSLIARVLTNSINNLLSSANSNDLTFNSLISGFLINGLISFIIKTGLIPVLNLIIKSFVNPILKTGLDSIVNPLYKTSISSIANPLLLTLNEVVTPLSKSLNNPLLDKIVCLIPNELPLELPVNIVNAILAHVFNAIENRFSDFSHASISFLIAKFIPKISFLTVSILFNNLIFILSSLLLHKISLLFFNNKISYVSALYFICNPASIIYSSMYSESLFTFLFLLGLWYSIHKNFFKASLLFSLSSLCRSNAIMFVLFVKSLYIPICLIPISIFQIFSLGCIWNYNCTTKLLIPYSYVQNKYWQQGFLKFFTLGNIPNVAIGLPVILLSIYFIFNFKTLYESIYLNGNQSHGSADRRVELVNNLESGAGGTRGLCANKTCTRSDHSAHCTSRNHSRSQKYRLVDFKKLFALYNLKCLLLDPFGCDSNNVFQKLISILAFQIILTIFFIHWNIVMRFIAFNPIIYWMAAHLSVKHVNSKFLIPTVTFFMVYGILYTVMFSCFYPPA